MLRRLYDWTMNLAAHRHATPALAAVSFIESSFFPIPPDALLIPMVLADRAKAFRIALVCTIASVLGGMLGYAADRKNPLEKTFARPVPKPFKANFRPDLIATASDIKKALAGDGTTLIDNRSTDQFLGINKIDGHPRPFQLGRGSRQRAHGRSRATLPAN